MNDIEQLTEKYRKILNETSLSRIFQHSIDLQRPLGIISGFRGSNDYKTNVENNKQISYKLKSHGYGYVYVEGSYIEGDRKVKEDSIFVIGMKNEDGNLKGLLKTLIQEFDQEAFLYKPVNNTNAYLIYANGTEVKLGEFHPNRISDYMTKLKGTNGTFVFENFSEDLNWLERLGRDKQKEI